ncbi:MULTISPECIES: ADP-ribosylglycohydrolase family protein [Actinomadura]|uniref:ADP-ribosylglycohydrolase family protein n=1 Tax=Actinomadura litoris TaxID=2678616 RepID=A0A7K1KY29_9ACTN|nr:MULTISPECIES: ADP-ribosylglycohydrolase family protein [Actinomadura]MBT2209073.1 ADP-ribosylglycohydrolase family protein [Actinomadura sp. NEAU-AAG7]MUN37110.1 ADP-ribosylglycohydrolase family protein [Actinomadura litoris]
MPDLSVYPAPDRVLGCLLGGGIGDALGAPLEGFTLDVIREKHGPDGPDDFVAERFGRGAITDDTQLTMFTAYALVQASARERAGGGARGVGTAAPGLLQAAYLTWFRGQGEEFPDQGVEGGGWLAGEPALMTRRGPGRSTLAALHRAAERRRPTVPLGTPREPNGDSKGCGGTMRAAPCGFGHADPADAFELGCRAAALTHGHPSGYLPAGVHAAMVSALLRGAELEESLHLAREQLKRHPGNRETLEALGHAASLRHEGPATPERLQTLGGGWTGDQAIAIAVYAALAPGDVESRLRLAVTHTGDSDSTGAICGNLLGARYGADAFPRRWRDGLEVGSALTRLAAACSAEFGPNPPADPGGHPIAQ